MAKSYNDISNGLIDNAKLLWLNFHILALGYGEDKAFRFINLLTQNKSKEEDHQTKPQVSDLKEEKNKQKIIQKEKRENQMPACFTTFCPFTRWCPTPESYGSSTFVLPSFALLLSAFSGFFTSGLPIFALSALSALYVLSALSVLFALLLSALLLSALFLPSAPFALLMSASFLFALSNLSTLSALFALSMLSALLALFALSVLSVSSIPFVLSTFSIPAIP